MTANSTLVISNRFRDQLILSCFAAARKAERNNHKEHHSYGMGLLAGLYHTGALTPDQYNSTMDFLCNCILSRLSEINEEEMRNDQ